ncbi:MAG: hypothetical protein HC890_09060 [Chloroflexaceae bacterium]|nr:hypothetical protein [Chloroflexaceae bacterium]
MRRRALRSRATAQVELFPFLSVLSCTIGTLILLIIVISTQTPQEQKQITIIAKTEQGENQSKLPRYLEVRQNGVIIYPSQTLVLTEDLERPNSALATLLSQVEQAKDAQYLIVAVRPEGVEIFDRVRRQIESRGIDIGYEPIDSDWTLKIQSSPTN